MRIAWPSGNRRERRECRMMASPMARLQTKKAGGSDHRLSRINRHSLRNGFTAYTRPPRCPGFLATVTCGIARKLDPSVGRSGPRDFAVRVRHVRPSWQTRPSHPRPTVRDDRPKRPSSSRQDARNAACDLPDEASDGGCGRLARRAKWAWGVCGNCVSGERAHRIA